MKSEIRISKFETISNDKNSNVPNNKFEKLEHWDFEFVSCFGFSASSLKIKRAS